MYPPHSCPNPCPYLCPAGNVSAPSAMCHCLPSDTSWSAVLYGLPPLACMPPRTVAPAAACLHQSLCSAVGAAETFCTGLGGWRRVRQDASGNRDAAVVVWWRGALCVCAFGGWWRQVAQKVDGWSTVWDGETQPCTDLSRCLEWTATRHCQHSAMPRCQQQGWHAEAWGAARSVRGVRAGLAPVLGVHRRALARACAFPRHLFLASRLAKDNPRRVHRHDNDCA